MAVVENETTVLTVSASDAENDNLSLFKLSLEE